MRNRKLHFNVLFISICVKVGVRMGPSGQVNFVREGFCLPH
jgi:hypothetical protein